MVRAFPIGVGFALWAVALSGAFLGCSSESGIEEEGDTEATVGGCGVERWSVKTGTDTTASNIDPTLVDTTVTALATFSVPASLPATSRIAPHEDTTYRLRNVTLVSVKQEADGDYHLVLSDGHQTMIAEIPSPSCVGSTSPLRSKIQSARATLDAAFHVSGSVTKIGHPVTVSGVGFFDFKHGQNGVAPDGFELHPVLDICFGLDCAGSAPPPPVDAGGPPHDAGHDSGHDGGGDSGHDAGGPPPPDAGHGTTPIQTVFVVVMENHNWSSIKGNASAPYINHTLLPQASHAESYYNPPGNHPSLPNYLWMEAGTNFGITNDSPPSTNHQSTTRHLTSLLTNAGVSWRAYQEGITGASCPLTASGLYAPKHLPFVYFDDVTNQNSSSSPTCIQHVRPYAELSRDLSNGTVARYNFITPNLCDDMHNSSGCASSDSVANGDAWLSREIPNILASSAYQNGGALFITWDESEGGDFPIGMIVLSPSAKGGGYSNTLAYSHSSLLRSVETIFGVTPMLGDAANASDLADLFRSFP
jgi:hypothetical protein